MAHHAPILTATRLLNALSRIPALADHPRAADLAQVACGGTSLSSSGYPFIVEESFRRFVDNVPHLFADGLAVLHWEEALQRFIATYDDLRPSEEESLQRSARVLRTMVQTAAVTAPSDLWLLRQILGVHAQLGLLDALREGQDLDLKAFAAQHDLDADHLSHDWHFLVSRGFLVHVEGRYRLTTVPSANLALQTVMPLPDVWRRNLIGKLVAWFREGDPAERSFLETWSALETSPQPKTNWLPDLHTIEVGYRLLPLVLGLRANQYTRLLRRGAQVAEQVPHWLPCFEIILREAALVDEEGRVNRLGERVFQRGPGPMGIIGAYEAYLTVLEDLIRGRPVERWVSRGENVAASQDANRKTFEAGNEALDRFCQTYGYDYEVYIEHAVGKGEATRQRFERPGGKELLYFGADLEDAAIDEAVKQQNLGVLPPNMRFIRNADIGQPARVIDALDGWQVPTHGAVMIVGNGFHEVRRQTNERMVQIFAGYQEAGMFLIFTEESALSDDHLIHTAWNTYHAGFRYTHELSGQGLRPAVQEGDGGRWSWPRCAEEAGYVVLGDYTHRTRTIFPYRKGHARNPSISVTYFCVPEVFASRLGVETPC